MVIKRLNFLENMPPAANHGPGVGTTLCLFCEANFNTVF